MQRLERHVIHHERRKKDKGQSCCGRPLTGQFPPDLPIVHEALVGEEARRQVKGEGTEADDDSEIVSAGGPLPIVGGWESEGVTFEDAVGRVGLFSETETAL